MSIVPASLSRIESLNKELEEIIPEKTLSQEIRNASILYQYDRAYCLEQIKARWEEKQRWDRLSHVINVSDLKRNVCSLWFTSQERASLKTVFKEFPEDSLKIFFSARVGGSFQLKLRTILQIGLAFQINHTSGQLSSKWKGMLGNYSVWSIRGNKRVMHYYIVTHCLNDRDETSNKNKKICEIFELTRGGFACHTRFYQNDRSIYEINIAEFLRVDECVHLVRPFSYIIESLSKTGRVKINAFGKLYVGSIGPFALRLSDQYKAMLSAAYGIQFLHSKNHIHGNINPSNIYIDFYNLFSLGNYASCREFEERFNEGARGYAAPETFRIAKAHPSRDIWELGATGMDLLEVEISERFIKAKQANDFTQIIMDKYCKDQREQLEDLNKMHPYLEIMLETFDFYTELQQVDPLKRPEIEYVIKRLEEMCEKFESTCM